MATTPQDAPEAGQPYLPTPLPEARAFMWADLLTPTRRGLQELFFWLEAASENNATGAGSNTEHLSTSLLVSGARGSGKTTLLLSAVQALRDWKSFVRGPPSPEVAALSLTLERLERRVLWLEPLDLEPVPSQANLLATLLVRVRAALDHPRHAKGIRGESSRWSSSILEEGAEETWGKLDHLIRDASFMWEDIPSTTDARVRAEQQIRASEIYANFQPRFADAMEDVSRTLSMPRFGTSGGEQVLMVLPIDNVDRSIEHLYNIVKLTRMVASRHLWFVLAAGHQEFQRFMERSFQKELIVSGQAGIGVRGQEETLAIARRQAATTLRRALPPSYRIALEQVDSHEAWRFPVDKKDELLGLLLRQLLLPTGKRTQSQVLDTFDDLIDLSSRLMPDVARCYREALRTDGAEAHETGTRPDEPLLHHVGRLALTLPARTLQDLWHSVRREVLISGTSAAGTGLNGAQEQGESSVRVAAEMLRNAIDESDLPAWASELLHHRILRQDDQGRVCLDLTGKPIRRSTRTSLHGVLQGPPSDPSGNGTGAHARVLSTEVHLRRFHEVLLVLADPEDPGRETTLPANVAGWFMILHDVLMLFERPRVLSAELMALELSPKMMGTVHELWAGRALGEPFVQAAFWWTPPAWTTFIEFAILTAQWRAFLARLSRGFLSAGDGQDTALRARFIQAAWVENVCSVAGLELGRWDWGNERHGVVSVLRAPQLATALERYEQRVRDTVAGLVSQIHKHSAGYDRLWTAQVWLRDELPLQVLPEHALTADGRSLLRQPPGAPSADGGWVSLVKDWGNQAPRLSAFRQQRVRDAVNRSSAAESLRRMLGTGRGRASETYYSWLDTMVDAWFTVVDHHGDPLAEVVLGMSPYLAPRATDDHP
ncbi:hypothetical protein COCOR_04385 [Corallococcus coralloides DSM 2259]|uniref:Uncharacterized protein n=1 Tax=Corallococcus coralloides (strain ATCC 25202 / DSM 2259 / NBRC 100086 / M2) TaxID=1144275 RepID=H8N1Z7_CORCM|nr:hypothetical protein [Corallococcus coralloides]AFE05801.1 hypothetical protein COCOR_04385 [Corallococcus coralloides DSM 2259]